jgi:hypothetical protein
MSRPTSQRGPLGAQRDLSCFAGLARASSLGAPAAGRASRPVLESSGEGRGVGEAEFAGDGRQRFVGEEHTPGEFESRLVAEISSSAEKYRHVARRMSLIASSAVGHRTEQIRRKNRQPDKNWIGKAQIFDLTVLFSSIGCPPKAEAKG